MKQIQQMFSIAFIMFFANGCAWQQNPTPATLDNSIYNQDSLNLILHSVSDALGSKLLSKGTMPDGTYAQVYALTLKNKPVAVSIFSTASNNTYFVNLMQLTSISDHLFARKNNSIIHSDTQVTRVTYKDITNPDAKKYVDSLGFSPKNYFLKRTTYFYKDNQSLTLVDYIFPASKK